MSGPIKLSWRWIIRGTCLGLLGLSVGLWGLSYFFTAGVVHESGSSEVRLGVQHGRVNLAQLHVRRFASVAGWHAELYAAPPGRPFTLHLLDGRVLGFTVDPVLFSWTNWDVGIPLWFSTVLFAVVALSAWRNTSRGEAARGFPIEPLASRRENAGG